LFVCNYKLQLLQRIQTETASTGCQTHLCCDMAFLGDSKVETGDSMLK
jgi:hypothetical protein